MTERTFATALKFHMDRGTRPTANLHGRPWTIAELATVVGCSDKIVSVWLNGGIPSRKNVFEVEVALFGDVPAEDPGEIGRWRTEFRAAADRERRLLTKSPPDDDKAAAEKVDGRRDVTAGAVESPSAAHVNDPNARPEGDPAGQTRRWPVSLRLGAAAVLLIAIVVAIATMTGEPGLSVANSGAGAAAVPAQDSGPPLPAYSVVEIEVTDPQLFIQFAQQLGPAIIAAGGRSLTLPVAAQVLHEGEAPKGIGITFWPNVEVATAFYNSPTFLNLLPMRDRAANIVRLVTIVGLPLPEEP